MEQKAQATTRRFHGSKVVLYIVLTLLAAYTLAPLYFLLVNSFKSQSEIVRNPLSLPSLWDFSYLSSGGKN